MQFKNRIFCAILTFMSQIVLSLINPIGLSDLEKLKPEIDVIELRLDIFPFKKEYLKSLSEKSGKRIILKFPPDYKVLKIYEKFLNNERFLIDVDFKFYLKIKDFAEIAEERTILSFHNFKSSDNLFKYYKKMGEYPPKYLKIIGTFKNLNDFEELEKIYNNSKNDKKIVSFLMGDGIPAFSRFYSIKMGNPFFYTFLNGKTASGQINIRELVKNNYQIKKIDKNTLFYGLVGEKIENSLSPLIHNTIFSNLEKNCFYLKIPTKKLSTKEFEFFSKYFKGLSVTSPHKIKILKYINLKSDEVEKVKNINTVKFDGDKIHGFNTDIYGFKKALINFLNGNKINTALVLGSGGSAKSVIYSLLSMGITVFIHSRNKKKGSEISKYFRIKFLNQEELNYFDLIVNCTTAGSNSQMDEIPIPENRINSKFLFDLIYSPPETKLMKVARKKRIKTCNGLKMLILQAIRQDVIWNIVKEDMEEKFSKLLNSKIQISQDKYVY